MSWLGLDIGGANLKAADGRSWAKSVGFALWRDPQGLPDALERLVRSAPNAERLAVTMTGELCDCFSSKAEGVRHIASAVDQIANGRETRVYLVNGNLATIAEALATPKLAAASNWHALASFACRFLPDRTGLLIDIGSTTTDIIPLVDGRVAAIGCNDTERLLSGELVYRGVGRTPICAVTNTLPWRGETCPIAAEVFATTADAYVLTGELDEEPEATWTADGRPLTKKHAQQRFARQLCADASDLTAENLEQLAASVRDAQLSELMHAAGVIATRMSLLPNACIVSGSGEFLSRLAVQRLWPNCHVISLSERIGARCSQCAPAHAVATLAAAAGKPPCDKMGR
jgi:probable H4MPT-linked C1 transfer pathway protein